MSFPAPPPATTPPPDKPVLWGWVPIRSLAPRHRERITAHLLALREQDRYLRFGYPATDAQLSKYVDMLDFEHDEVFGIFNRRLDLIAMAHLAHPVQRSDERTPVSEFGVSVVPTARGRGFGRRLFEHATLHARNRGVHSLLIHALSENTAMLRIARNAGAVIERDGPDAQALLRLPADSIGSHVGELVEQKAAELDYQLKLRGRQVARVLSALGEVKGQFSKAGSHVAEE